MPMVAIDIGGTFTDLASFDRESGELKFAKSLTTPPQFECGARDCLNLAAISADEIDMLRHGTTVVINALLERRGAKTALVATAGFRDILEIGRGNRPESFNLFYERLPPVIPRELRFDLRERMDARGQELVPVDMDALTKLAEDLRKAKVEAIAVCFLHAWHNPQHEIEAGGYLRKHTDCFVTCSHEISREFREFERTSTAALNAYVGPAVDRYISGFDGALRADGFAGHLFLMGSNGGILTKDDAHRSPLLLVESGPVGGVAGAAEIGALCGLEKVVAFDMGGTTAKAALIENGAAHVSSLYWVGGYERGYPVQAAVVDVVEVGYGGGSIAGRDEVGSLTVGPRSAGAVPGPACYGRGGVEPTVTDANLLLGRLDADWFLGGAMKLDRARATAALADLARNFDRPVDLLASGILRIVTVNMANAVRQVTLERGFDPRDFAMVAFGGAGPLHVVAVAREIGIGTVIIPPQPGHFSAYGMLFADFRTDLAATLISPMDTVDLRVVNERLAEMDDEGRRRIAGMGLHLDSVRTTRFAEMRYRRQEHTVRVRLPDEHIDDRSRIASSFEDAYGRRFGHNPPNMDIELVMLRVVVDGRIARPELVAPRGRLHPVPGVRRVWFDTVGLVDCQVWRRSELARGHHVAGPAVVEEDASTTVIDPGDTAEIDAIGNIIVTLGRRA